MTVCSEICAQAMLLSNVKGIGAVKLKELMRLDNFATMNTDEFAEIIPNYIKADADEALSLLKNSRRTVEQQLELAEKMNIRIICSSDELYPELLKKSKFDPSILYVKGELGRRKRSAAVIGIREPPEKFDVVGRRITGNLVERGFSIVSGLALGCDSIAHKAALEFHGHTVAVLGHGLDHLYPKENKKLSEDIVASGGALVSQFPIGDAPNKFNFVKRDKIQSGLSDLVVMLASGVPGGSLIATKSILDDRRHLFVPAPMNSIAGSGMLKANITFVRGNVAEICDMLGITSAEKYPSDLVHIINGKNDYDLFETAVCGRTDNKGDSIDESDHAPGQTSLF